MLIECFVSLVMVFWGLHSAMADTIQLKDKAAVVGKVLSEKRDQVAVDVGYTVLVIPRNQIVKVSKTDPAEPVSKPQTTTRSAQGDGDAVAVREATKPGFYAVPSKPSPLRS